MQRRLKVRLSTSRWSEMVGFCTVGLLLFLGTPGAEAGRSATFPTPDVLRPNVAFWKQIFTTLDSRSGLLHDASDVTIVYHTFQELPENSRQRQRLIDRYRRRYQRILLRLAQGKRQRLSRDETRVLALFEGKLQRKVLRAAAHDIRFQSGLRDRFAGGVVRSGAYLPTIHRIFEAAGLPTELGLLPHVESSFNNDAYSKYGAAGMWQFTRSTGQRFLHVSRAIDERLDFRRAAVAAARLLQENYQELGTWPLAITAYNHGIHGMKRAIARLSTRDFGTIVQRYRSRSFGFASKNFYAEFLAVLDIVTHLNDHFRDIALNRPQSYHTLKLDAYVSFRTVAKYLRVEAEDLARWNPALRQPILQSKRLIPKEFVLYVPHHRLSPAETQIRWANVPNTEKFTQQIYGQKYRIQPGDSLSTIARRFRTSVETLMDLNDIERPHLIKAGRRLRLPDQHRYRTAAQPPSHLLMAGFPLNDLSDPETEAWLQVQDGTIRVVATETLGRYATWLDVSVRRLRKLNHLSRRAKLPLGTRLRLDFSKVSEDLFTERRLTYHRDIEEQFFRAYAVDGVITHTLKPGETLWTLAHQEYDVPLWLLQKYNHDLEFHTLTPGTKLRIPQVVARKAS